MLMPMAYLLESSCIFDQGFCFDLLATDGDDLVHGAVTDHLAHDRFGNVTQCTAWLAHFEQVFDRVVDAVLDHPFHQCCVQITGYHFRFELAVPWALERVGGARGGKTEFLLQLPFDRDNGRHVDTKGNLKCSPGGTSLTYLPKRWMIATESLGTV